MTFVCDAAQNVEEFIVRPVSPSRLPVTTDIVVITARVQPEDDTGDEKPIRRFHMLFTLEDVEFGPLIKAWMRLTQHYTDACNIFFGLEYGPPAYIDMKFLGVVQSLVLYHARWRDILARREEEELRLQRILSDLLPSDGEWIIDQLGIRPPQPFQKVLHDLVDAHSENLNPLLSNRQDRFVNDVMNTLGYVILRDQDLKGAVRLGADLYWMMQKLRFLFKACLLRELGFSAEMINKLFERNPLYQHIRQLETAEESGRSQVPTDK